MTSRERRDTPVRDGEESISILAFSDFRTQDIQDLLGYIGNLARKPDVIIYAGDDINRFNADGNNLFVELAKGARCGVLAVVGNDDPHDIKKIISAPRVHDLHDSPFVVGKWAFVGQEGAVGDIGVVLYSEEAVKRHLDAQLRSFNRKKIILVSHAPPYGVLDFARRFGARHIGSKAVRSAVIKNHAIKLVICGHVHIYGGRVEKLKQASVLNIASHDEPDSPSLIAHINFYPWEDTPIINVATVENQEILSLHDVGPVRLRLLADGGYDSIKQLLKSNPREITQRTSIPVGFSKRIFLSALARTNKLVYRLKEFRFPENPVYLDVETTPFECFMTGVYDPKEKEFSHFIVEDVENSDEKSKVERRLNAFLRSHGQTIVTYGPYDLQFISESVLDKKSYFDICSELRRCYVVKSHNYKLQTVAREFLSDFNDDGLTGRDMPRLYSDFRRTNDIETMNIIRRHNKNDVMYMHRIIEMLRADQIQYSDEFLNS